MDSVTVAAQQDALRPLRQFVGAISGAVSGYDQANAYSDFGAYSYGLPGYQSVGPYGVSIEGTSYGLPISPTAGGGVYISPMAVLFCLGVAAALLWKK
jgi:hypothetical protein